VTLSPEFQWISNHGGVLPGRTLVLPAGEVNTFPARIDGTFVADGAINVNRRIAFDVRLAEHPVTVRIEDGRAVDVRCDDPGTLTFLRRAFAPTPPTSSANWASAPTSASPASSATTTTSTSGIRASTSASASTDSPAG